MSQKPFKSLHVRLRPGHKTQGQLIAGNKVIRCALGRSGIGINKREGDGKTPRGRFALLETFVRSDKTRRKYHSLPLRQINPNDGWCNSVGDRNYNRFVALPYPASHEKLMRDDNLYDVFVVMDHNVTNWMRRGGSAIFFHLAKSDYGPTEGCVAISRRDMEWLLPRIGRETVIVVG